MEYTNKAFIKAIEDEHVIIAGWGVVFSSVDREGDAFTKATDYWLGEQSERPVFFEHGLDDAVSTRVLGSAIVSAFDGGLWIDAKLERHSRCVKAVLELVELGILGWSSGAMPSDVKRANRAGKSVLVTWPIIEFSLTPATADASMYGAELESIGAL